MRAEFEPSESDIFVDDPVPKVKRTTQTDYEPLPFDWREGLHRLFGLEPPTPVDSLIADVQ
jgi:hypothetical protein